MTRPAWKWMIPACGAVLAVTVRLFAQGAAPKPPLERLPAVPYIAPPTPEQKAHQAREAASNAVARAEYNAACAAVLEAVAGAKAPTNWQERIKAAGALKVHAAALKKVKEDAERGKPEAMVATNEYSAAKGKP